jgi:hypothetical protein
MYARLWWKDARQFWPIWVFLALGAAVLQGLLLYYVGHDARQGWLGVLALLCASLYAFATGAAAFAGEREVGTLTLLDIVPVDRRIVWTSKVSFALVTTLALTLILLVMAAVSTDRWKQEGSLSVWEALSFGMIVLVALGWGLFWSAILSNALTAAVIAICSTGLSLSFLSVGLNELVHMRVNLTILVLWEFLVFLATLIASDLIFARVLRWKRLQLEFRSPIVVNLADSTSSMRAQLQIQSPVATVLTPRLTTEITGSRATDQPPRQSWVSQARVLAWQTIKEGWKTWILLAAISLVLPAPFYLRLVHFDSFWLMVISIGVTLVAGASVFGRESQGRTHRFLAYHGARSGFVWLIKLAVWSTGMVMVWAPLALMAKDTMDHVGGATERWLFGSLVIPLFFGVAQLCGMAIRRGITAVVIALVIGLALMIPLGALLDFQMLPVQGLLVIPVGLLAVSWAWSGDWLLDRPAPGRWVRLGLLLTGMFSLIVSWYAGYRAWSIPDVGPITPPAVWLEAASTPLPADQNAAELYREAGHRLVGVVDPFKHSPEFFDRNRGLLGLLRRAAAMPDCRFLEPQKLTVLDRLDLPPVSQLAYLLALDASERQNQGDLAGAWDDIMATFHMANHVGTGTGLVSAFPNVTWVEQNALGVALEWAVARGQTPDRLHAALAAYRDLPKMPLAADVVRADANLVDNTLDLPTSRLREWVFESANGRTRSQSALDSMLFDLATMPWERVRVRRVNHLFAQAAIRDAMTEPWQRPGVHDPKIIRRSKQLLGSQRPRVHDPEIDYAQKTSRNAMMLIPNMQGYIETNDRNEVGRRALILVLALREWQLRHNGQFPESLDALVPEELPRLPDDPYSGRPFGYVRSHALGVLPLRSALGPASSAQSRLRRPGSRLLYSVGPDGHDNGGVTFIENVQLSQPLDIVFEVPPIEGDSGTSKGKDQGNDAGKDRPAPAGRP